MSSNSPNRSHSPLKSPTISKKWLFFALLWLALLVYVLLIKVSATGLPKIPNADKIGHFGLFFGQFWLFGRAVKSWQVGKFWAVGLSLALLLAVASELAQGFLTTYRAMEVADGVADMIGAGAALALVRWADGQGYLKK